SRRFESTKLLKWSIPIVAVAIKEGNDHSKAVGRSEADRANLAPTGLHVNGKVIGPLALVVETGEIAKGGVDEDFQRNFIEGAFGVLARLYEVGNNYGALAPIAKDGGRVVRREDFRLE